MGKWKRKKNDVAQSRRSLSPAFDVKRSFKGPAVSLNDIQEA